MDLARELHKPVIKKFKTRKIITTGIDQIWEADLLIMSKYKKENEGYVYILNVIDCFSKYAWCVPLKTKSARDVAAAFETILEKKGRQWKKRRPKLLHVDRGKEFVNALFKKLLQKYNIEMYHTFSEVKAAMVERFNRTLNEKLKLHFEVNQNHHWLKILPKVLKQYNEKDVHRSTGLSPINVTSKTEADVYKKMYGVESNFKLPKPTLKIGDRVRITSYKYTFANKYSRKWTTEIFIIHQVHLTVPVTYTLKALDGDIIEGKFYKQELQKTKF